MDVKIESLARCINLPKDTLERWIRQGRIPVNKIGNTCVFNENTLAKWASANALSFNPAGANTSAPNAPEYGRHTRIVNTEESLVSAMRRGGVLHNVEGTDALTVIRAAVDRISFLSAGDKDALYAQLIERENLMSTGIGNGVSIPHPRTPISHIIEASTIISCFLAEPVDFKAVDDQPVFILFVMLSPSTKMHLHVLSRLAFILRNNAFIDFLRKTPDPESFFDEVEKLEEQLDP